MEILKRPLISEKITQQNEKGIYGFEVHTKANKIQIKEAIEKTYGVNVEAVRTAIVPGRVKNRISRGRYVTGRTPGYKKAIVQLAQGEVLDFFGGETE